MRAEFCVKKFGLLMKKWDMMLTGCLYPQAAVFPLIRGASEQSQKHPNVSSVLRGWGASNVEASSKSCFTSESSELSHSSVAIYPRSDAGEIYEGICFSINM